MTTFHELFRQPTRPAGGEFPPDRRRELLPARLARSRALRLWAPGDPIPADGCRLLIGVATWSGHDLNLLDAAEDARPVSAAVDVFDLDDCRTADDFSRYIPGAEPPLQSPFVGRWCNGRLVESASGFAGRQLVARVLALEPAALEARMQSAFSSK